LTSPLLLLCFTTGRQDLLGHDAFGRTSRFFLLFFFGACILAEKMARFAGIIVAVYAYFYTGSRNGTAVFSIYACLDSVILSMNAGIGFLICMFCWNSLASRVAFGLNANYFLQGSS
jgi:hypothetical protein